MHYTVLKADGTSEFFKVEKLRRSLRRAGATPKEIYDIISHVETRLFDGIRTQEIYRLAFDYLRNNERKAATRYSLRRALFGLGPTGFPFELYLAKLFQHEGYKTETGIIIEGNCVPHEIDIAAYKNDHSFIGEAKYHARPGIKTDLQVAMYSYARLLDLRNRRICDSDICGIKEFWLITNTKFTVTAEKYGSCSGITMLSFDYPRKNNLHDRIQRSGVYPITVLHSLTQREITFLIQNNIITCSDISKNPHRLELLRFSKSKQQVIMDEIANIANSIM